MKDVPILFSAPMIRALLREAEAPGTGKTQTRRTAWREVVHDQPKYRLEGTGKLRILATEYPTVWRRRYDRWVAGDRELWLWVRETMAWTEAPEGMGNREYCWPADWEDFDRRGWGLEPSIHMKRIHSRLSLHVTDMRLERLQDITFIDAKAEGIEYEKGYTDPRDAFANLWASIHGPSSWAANPEVIAISFTVHQQNIDAIERAA